MVAPEVSIIMPVFNSGAYLAEAIDSVLNQRSTTSCEVPNFELIVVDDHSTDPVTLEILSAYSRQDPRVIVITNQRNKGAAGARNTGISHARAAWIGFLDSDDIWYPDALAVRWKVITDNGHARWIGARFTLLKADLSDSGKPQFPSAENLIAALPHTSDSPSVNVLRRPVAEFGASCITGIMTVLIQRTLVIEAGMFNERLPRSEDYYLWFKCASEADLFMLQIDIAFYRIHPGSLTHGKAPRFLHEDVMLTLLLRDVVDGAHKEIFIKRYDLVMQDHCYFYRGQKKFDEAGRFAWEWVKRRPLNLASWKELIATSFGIG